MSLPNLCHSSFSILPSLRVGSFLQEQYPTAACTVSDRGKGHFCRSSTHPTAACTVFDRRKGHLCRSTPLLHVLSLTEGRVIFAEEVPH